MKLAKIHENFIRESRETILWNQLPIKAKDIETPIVPVERWEIRGDPKFLTKIFRFQNLSERNEFLKFIFNYEKETNHGSSLLIRDEIVKISLRTKGVDEITSLDKEYAKFADETFKDVVIFSKISK
jgi:pterin-4a-carbinolamine dehydratase